MVSLVSLSEPISPHHTSEGLSPQPPGLATLLTLHIPDTEQECPEGQGPGSYRALSAGSEKRGTFYLILYGPRNMTLGFYLSVRTPRSRYRVRALVSDCL